MPRDCQVYYSCHASTDGKWVATKCTCKNGLMFDPDLEVCTWPSGDCASLTSLARLVMNLNYHIKVEIVDDDVCDA